MILLRNEIPTGICDYDHNNNYIAIPNNTLLTRINHFKIFFRLRVVTNLLSNFILLD